MANHASAIKRHRQSVKRNANNSMNRHKLRTQLKKLRTAISAGNSGDAKALLPKTCSLLDKSVQKGVIKKNTAQRHKSRLAKAISAIPAA